MGKIRVRTLGDEKTEKQEKKKSQLRTEAKKPREEVKEEIKVEVKGKNWILDPYLIGWKSFKKPR